MPGARILVADDDTWILKMVSSVLERRGYAVETANDGEEAWHLALASKPDLVITDVMMPKVDGWALVRALRARPEFAFTPVIFLTALNSDEDRIKGFRLGADDYLPKPFRFEELDLRVERVIKRTLQLREAAKSQFDKPTLDNASTAPLSAGAIAETGTPSLIGNLEQIGLSALLTMIELERKSGLMTVWNDPDAASASQVGRLYIRTGRIVAAELDGRTTPRNAECVFHLLEWSRGRFELKPGVVERENEIDSTITHLLMEGARLMDER
jgi:CheY-like chemotaxis protein